MKRRAGVITGFALGALVVGTVVNAPATQADRRRTDVVPYQWTDQASYDAKWLNIYGASQGTATVGEDAITVDASRFDPGIDFSVYDHLKYIRISGDSFSMPEKGSLEFSVDITAHTIGTDTDRVIEGCYLDQPFAFWDGASACARPYAQKVLEGQQAGVVLNMINFETGQLFDWFVSENKVFALIERLPSNVTDPQDLIPGEVGLDKAYTQIIKEATITPRASHNVAIRYTRGNGQSYVEYFLDGKIFARVDRVGVPLDVQHQPYTGTSPSLGAGEDLRDQLDSFVIGHGLFSLLDAFPFQHPDRPDLSVSVPMSERLFGQGATGSWKQFKVTQVTD
jgi:hypothetical protein